MYLYKIEKEKNSTSAGAKKSQAIHVFISISSKINNTSVLIHSYIHFHALINDGNTTFDISFITKYAPTFIYFSKRPNNQKTGRRFIKCSSILTRNSTMQEYKVQ